MVNFADKFGLPKDRVKLEAGLTNFDIVKIEMIKSKKAYDVREETEAGTKISKKKIDIAYLDVHLFDDNDKPSKEISKYYSPNAPVVASCKEILETFGKPDGSLREPVHINEVKEGMGENKNPYLFFT